MTRTLPFLSLAVRSDEALTLETSVSLSYGGNLTLKYHLIPNFFQIFLNKLSPSFFFQLRDYDLLTFACYEKCCSNKCFVIGLICLHSAIISSVFVCFIFSRARIRL